MALIEDLQARHAFHRVLDVGMGFQTLLLEKLLPGSRIDCLGVEQDNRFRPSRDFTFYAADLNDAAIEVPPGPIAARFDLIVFMEVLEHLYTPPDLILGYLASLLTDGGVIIVTTPNAVWLKNRLKMLRGKNPFETLRPNRKDMGHIREYTKAKLEKTFSATELHQLSFERRGLHHFNNLKDNGYSFMADRIHSSLSRTLVAVYQKAGRATE